MADSLTPDLCIIGAGSGGLSVAAGAVQMGASVVLVERGLMGGDCLNYGCVPSKSLIAAAHAAQAMRTCGPLGVTASEPAVDFAAVMSHVRAVIAGIAPHDSVERFEGLGVRVIQAEARFVNADEIEAGGLKVRPRRFVVATGSRATIPPIPGLDTVAYLTNETIFSIATLPSHLVVIGGGPIGCELAQAFRRLGAQVTVASHGAILPKDDPELVAVVRERLASEGVRLLERVEVRRIEPGPKVVIFRDGVEESLDASHILVAAGRQANVESLDLDRAGIKHDRRGISVDAGLRSSNRRAYAIGDVAGGLQFTHVAGYHAGIVVRSALFRLPAKVDYASVPWTTFTDPELAHVGMSEAGALKQGHKVEVLRAPFADNDRAQAERETAGLVKVVVGGRGKILGASIVGKGAGELILPWALAIRQRIGIAAMAGVVAPYPTLSEASKRAAGSYFTPRLFTDRTRWIVRVLGKLG